MGRRKANRKVTFDDHMALDYPEVCAILKYFNLPKEPFWEWMMGQTCPMVDGKLGYYWYDLHRYIENRTNGQPLLWD